MASSTVKELVETYQTFRPLVRYIGPEGDASARRVFAPERWQVIEDVTGLHVLLIDDTW